MLHIGQVHISLYFNNACSGTQPCVRRDKDILKGYDGCLHRMYNVNMQKRIVVAPAMWISIYIHYHYIKIIHCLKGLTHNEKMQPHKFIYCLVKIYVHRN